MDVSYCITGKYPDTGQQPPACYYDENGNFIAVSYMIQDTVSLLGKQYDYDKYGNPIIGGPLVKGNIASLRMPPNGWTDLFINGGCNGQGTMIEGDGLMIVVDDPGQQVSCFKLGSNEWWNDYIRNCRAGFGDQVSCQQYAQSNGPPIVPVIPVPPVVPVTVTDPGNNRWWIYLVLGILIVLIIMLVLAGVYVTAKPKKSDVIKVEPVITTTPITKETDSTNETANISKVPKELNKPTKPSIPIAVPDKPRISYYKVE